MDDRHLLKYDEHEAPVRDDWHDRFDAWKRKVNRKVMRIAGLSCDDLGDACYAAEFDAGTTPEEMARIVLEENDFPFED